jgi:hypothetical protein
LAQGDPSNADWRMPARIPRRGWESLLILPSHRRQPPAMRGSPFAALRRREIGQGALNHASHRILRASTVVAILGGLH